MGQVELFPDLEHCIETTARMEHGKTVGQLMASIKVNKKLSEKAEILRIFLETADFKKLRSESEKYLLNSKDVEFVIYLENGVAKYRIRVT